METEGLLLGTADMTGELVYTVLQMWKSAISEWHSYGGSVPLPQQCSPKNCTGWEGAREEWYSGHWFEDPEAYLPAYKGIKVMARNHGFCLEVTLLREI